MLCLRKHQTGDECNRHRGLSPKAQAQPQVVDLPPPSNGHVHLSVNPPQGYVIEQVNSVPKGFDGFSLAKLSGAGKLLKIQWEHALVPQPLQSTVQHLSPNPPSQDAGLCANPSLLSKPSLSLSLNKAVYV